MIKRVLVLLVVILTSCATTKTASETIEFKHLNTINVGGKDATEISAYCENTKRLFITSTKDKAILVYDFQDVYQPQKITEIDILQYGGNANSVSVNNENLAIAIESKQRETNGTVVVLDSKTLKELKKYTVGALPDMVTYTKNGNYILSANEGEPNANYSIDPKGSVSIIDTKTDKVVTLNFDKYEAVLGELKQKGLRSFGKNATFSKDVEPEYITTSADGNKAWVTLQENNAIAAIDIKNKKIIDVYPLGFKDFSKPKNALDVSDSDGKIQLKTWKNVKGFYLPDAIASAEINNQYYVITANEGDSRDYEGFSEEIRVGQLKLDAARFPNAKKLQQDDQLGRLKVTTTRGDIDNDGDYDTLYAYGTRSFSIWSEDGKLVYDSGNEISKRTMGNAKAFNQNDSRSDDKGAEPEAVEILKIKDKTLVFVGLERTGGVLVYDISNPKQPKFLEWLNHSGDISPEGLLIIPAEKSPTKQNILVVSNEFSGTISLYEIK